LASTDRHPLRVTPFELASGIVVGEAPEAARPEIGPGGPTPREALEAAILPALRRPPCVVSFSGGLDSSLVLAVAARLAEREGLEPPVPVTLTVPSAPAAEESWWQRRVVYHVGLVDEWVQLAFAEGELDWIGPVAEPVLRRHGVLMPPNAFMHAPLLERARGGSLLTGVGGDNLLTGWTGRRASELLSRRVRPVPRDLLRVAFAYAPAELRALVLRLRAEAPEWLTPAAREEAVRRLAGEGASEPARWDRRVRWAARRRRLAAIRWSLGLLGADTDTRLFHPLCDPGFAYALGRAGGRGGLGDRNAIVGAIAGDALPDELLLRPDKALFHEVLYSTRFRAFVAEWAGEGVDAELVDRAALAAEWRKDVPHVHSAMLVQAAWLSAQGAERVDDGAER
jgi:asparagine synthase (glutamine-hydrolysing)